MSKTRIALLAGAIAVGAALRLPFLSNQSLWFDETFTRAIVSNDSLSGLLHGVHATESTPPLYYLLTWGWTQLFGLSTATLRMPGAIAGTLCVPAAYLALHRLIGASASIAAAWIVATSPMLVHYSLDARSYSLLVLLSIVSLWAMGALLRAPSRMRWGTWVLTCLALCYTHYFGVFVVLVEGVVLAAWLPQQRRALATATVALVALMLPLVPLLLHQRGNERTGFIAHASLSGRIEETLRQFAMGPNVPSAALEGAGLLLVATGVIAGGLALWRSGRKPALIALGALIASVVLLPLALAVTHIEDVFLARNLLGAWIAIAALTGLGLSRWRALPLALFLALCAIIVVAIQSNWRYQNVDWRDAIARLRVHIQGQSVAVYGRQAAPVAALYLNRRLASSPVVTKSLWVLVEPARLGTRALQPVRTTPTAGVPPAPFALRSEVVFDGVRALRFLAPRPVSVAPSALGLDSADGSPAALLAG